MSLFMDLHIVPDASLDDAVEAHRMDVKIQEQFGCNCMTFWFDEERGHAFCLIEAPSKDSVKEMHDHAHGLIPHQIIEVNENLVSAFLGRIQDPKSLDELSKSDIKAFYSDSAFRIILVTDHMDEKLLSIKLGKEKAQELLDLKNEIVRNQIKAYEGHEIEMAGKGIVISFVAPSQAYEYALAVLKQLHIATELLDFRIGLHAGIPVTDNDELFGETLKYAKNLCLFRQQKQIIISSAVDDLLKEYKSKLQPNNKIKSISSEDEKFLKGLVDCLEEKWNKTDLDINDLCKQLLVSSAQLYRKTTSLTGFSPNALLREYRLIKSLDLLKKGSKNVTQVAFNSGFNSPSYFTKCFQKRFQIKPLDYQKIEN